MSSRDPQTLCDGPETPTQWKSVSVTDLTTNLLILTRVGARDAYASTNVYLLSDSEKHDENLDNSARSPLL